LDGVDQKKDNTKVLIEYDLDGVKYLITEYDFDRVNAYCEDDCMGIKFRMNARFLKKIVKVLIFSDYQPPFRNKDFNTDHYRKLLEDNGILNLMQNQYGTDDVKLVTRLIIKSTYEFLNEKD
jgi:hypothetical protein